MPFARFDVVHLMAGFSGEGVSVDSAGVTNASVSALLVGVGVGVGDWALTEPVKNADITRLRNKTDKLRFIGKSERFENRVKVKDTA